MTEWYETAQPGDRYSYGDAEYMVTTGWDGLVMYHVHISGPKYRTLHREGFLRTKCTPDHVGNMRRHVAAVLGRLLLSSDKTDINGILFHRDRHGVLHAWGWDVDPMNGFDGWSPIHIDAAVRLAVPDDWQPPGGGE